MSIRRSWAFQSFVVCIAMNMALAGILFLMADKIMGGLTEWISPFTKPGVPNLPDDVRSAFGSLGIFLAQLHQYLAPALAAVMFSATLLLWFLVYLLGLRQIKRATGMAPAGFSNVDQESGNKPEKDGPP